MNLKVDTIFVFSQLATHRGISPRKGDEMRDLEIIENGAMAVKGGKIVETGRKQNLLQRYEGDIQFMEGELAIPAFVDSHTHCIFAGERRKELDLKLGGSSYSEILKGGGGILETVRRTRECEGGGLLHAARIRMMRMMRGGTTAFELKSGYGLNVLDEMKMLEVARRLGDEFNVAPTYLGAHAFPPERSRNDYVEEIVREQIPRVSAGRLASMCDVFIDSDAFSEDEAEKVLSTAKRYGLKITAHIDEFSQGDGVSLLSRVGAVSASHLAYTDSEGAGMLAEAGITGIILPSTPLFSMSDHYPDASRMVRAGMALALGTDLSPNSWNESMLVSALLSVYRCHLKPEEALAAATINSACAIGMGLERGTLEAGKKADFITLDASDFGELFYRHSEHMVTGVYSNGARLYRADEGRHKE